MVPKSPIEQPKRHHKVLYDAFFHFPGCNQLTLGLFVIATNLDSFLFYGFIEIVFGEN